MSRKRNLDEGVVAGQRSSPSQSPSLVVIDDDHLKKDWKVKTLDEILQEKRRKLDLESPEGDRESSRPSAKSSLVSSATSSPVLQIDSKASSKNQTPTQEIIYQLSPDHSSPHETTEKEPKESEEESLEDVTDSSSEDENEDTKEITVKVAEEKSSEEEESSDSDDDSDDSDDSSDEEEEEEEVEEKVQTENKTNTEEIHVVAEKEIESSEDESEDDSDDDTESEDSEEIDSSDEDDKETKTSTIDVEQEKAVKIDEVDFGVGKVEKDENTNRPNEEVVERQSKSREKERESGEVSSRHRKQAREDEEPRRVHKERHTSSTDKKDRRSNKDVKGRSNRKQQSSASESSDYKKSRDKVREKDRREIPRMRERLERQDRGDSREERSKETTKLKAKDSVPKVLTAHERLQFATEVVETDSDDYNSEADDSSDEDSDDELNVSQSREPGKEYNELPRLPRLPDYQPAIQGCRNVAEEFIWLNRIEEGTYGVVYRARDKRTNEIVALKRLKMEKEKEGFPITSLREINTLLKGQHPNIVTVREVVVGGNMDKIFIVMDYVEHDLKTLMEHMSSKFAIGEVKTLLVQLLRAVAHLHDNWILHRDLKTSNLLLSNKGILKVADFGLAREYGSPLKPYTPIVVTLWYRAPELLLGVKEYACPIDLWSVGCIFAELLTMKPLFPGKSEIDQINRIFKELGTPSDKIWPGPPSYSELPHVKKVTFTEYPYNQLRNKFGTHLTDKGFDLLNKFLTYDPMKRITADAGLKHEYFNESPYPIKPEMFPTWPAKSEMQKRPKRKDFAHSPPPPEGGEMFSKLKDGGDSSGAAGAQGFHMPPSKKGSAAVAGFSLKFGLK